MPEIEFTSIQVAGPGNGPGPNRWLRQVGEPRGLLVILPGLNYTCDNPLLYYLSRLAVDRGMDVLQLWADYTNPSFQFLTKPAQAQRLVEDARALIETGRKKRSYPKLVLAGKSIGTMTLAGLYVNMEALAEVPAIWFTPLLGFPAVLEGALQAKGKALFIGGTGDSTYDVAAMEQVRQAGQQTLVIPQADHSLEISGDIDATLMALRRVMAAASAFLDECL